MSAEFSPTCGRAAAMFSTFTAITLWSVGLLPVSGLTGSGRGVDGAALGVTVVEGLPLALVATTGGGTVPASSSPPTATAVPTPASTTAVLTAAIVCARFQTNPAMVLPGPDYSVSWLPGGRGTS